MRVRSGPLLTIIVVVACVIAALAVVEHARRSSDWLRTVSSIGPGLVMIGSGVLIARYRIGNRMWWLLVAAGFASFVGEFEHAGDAGLAQTAFVLGQWQIPLLAASILMFPSGRFESRTARTLATLAVGTFTVRTLARLLLFVPPDLTGHGTTNRFLPIDDDRWWRAVETACGYAISAVMVAMVIDLTARYIRSSAVGRRLLTPVMVATVLLAGSVFVQYVFGWNSGWAGLPVFYVVWWAQAGVAVALVWGLRRVGRTRSSVVDLVADLNQAAPSQLAEAIGDALGDPRLRLLMWSPTQHAYLDADAHAVQPSAGPQRAVTYVERHGEPLAALLHDAALLEDEGTLRAVSAVVAITVENAQLTQELAARLREVAESRARLVAAADTERRRIERDLHDGAQQRLVTVALDLKLAETGLTESVDEPMRRVLSRAVADLGDALTELRSLARGIHPAILTESGLCAALESLVDRTAVPVALRADIPAGMPPMIEATAYFTVSEALANVAKHADASHVAVTADITDGMLRIAVIDDGRGGADSTGSGLLGIKDRVNAVGGTLRVHSPAGSGTRLEIELPCE